MDNQQQTTITQDGFPVLAQPQENEQMTLFALQDMAVQTTQTLNTLSEELKTARETLQDAYKNSPAYTERETEVKNAQKALKDLKTQLNKVPEIIAYEQTVKELKSQLKDKKEGVSAYAIEMYRLSGNTEFEKDGATYEIKTVAKLVMHKQ